MQPDPVDKFQTWYLAQSNEVQEMIGFIVCHHVPRRKEKSLAALLEPKKSMVTYLNDIPREKFALLGEVLLIRAIIDFKITRQFGSSDDWQSKAEINQNIANDLEMEHGPNDLSNKLQDSLRSFPERKAMWIQAVNSWRALRNGDLSDESLEAWEEGQRI